MQIPGYRVIRKINQGGMSTVYLAIQKSVGREVALKVMSPALNADPVFSERFQREANIVGQLSHPNIIAIYDIGCFKNLNYIAMDYLPGGTIHDKMRTGITTDEALKITKEVAVALNVAHNKWFVHRDIKPENILFRADGTAVLTDFGVAKAVSANVTNAGTVVGTPYYMSPEQARGKALDRRSDLYSLGIVFYEMLTGTVPYKADEVVAIAIKHLTQPVPSLPPQYSIYQPILDKLLAKSPNERFQSGSELVAAIETIQSTLSGFTSNPANYTDTSSMSVMALFKALVLTSYAALKFHAKKILEKILHWRWTPNRGFYRRPNVKVTEIRTESFSDDENRATIVSTRVQKAAYFEESIGSKFSYITRTFTWIFILSIIWSSFSVGMIRIDAPISKYLPAPLAEAMLSTEGVIHTYADKLLGESKSQYTAKPNLKMLDYSVPENTQKANTDSYDLADNEHNEELKNLEKMSIDRYNSDFNPLNIKQKTTEIASFDIEANNESTSNYPDDISKAESEDIDEDNIEDDIENNNEPTVKESPTYALTINPTPSDARIRILNIKEKYSKGIKVKSGRYKLEISSPGFKTIIKNVTVKNKPLTLQYALTKILSTGDSLTDSLKEGGLGPELVIVPSGSFIMGNNEERHLSPERKVTLPKKLAVGKYEVTFNDYEKFVASTAFPTPDDNKWGGGNRPVINVSWDNAVAYTEWLSNQTGETYRLPSEAEWEYFSRAGTSTIFWWGDDIEDDKANCKRGCDGRLNELFKNKTSPVGSFSANPFLLFDTSGNVAEWTLDCYEKNYENTPIDGSPVLSNNCRKRVVRGGSLKDSRKNISSFERDDIKPNANEDFIGFRVVREIKDF